MNQNSKDNIVFGLRVILLICLIFFLVVFLTTDKSDCEKCVFELEGEELSAVGFYEIYYSNCIDKNMESNPFNITIINFTG